MKKFIFIGLLSILFLTGCHYLFGAWLFLATKESESTSTKYCSRCSCDPNYKERKQFDDCNNDGKYNENGEYLCCPNCSLVCKRKERWW